MTCIFVTKTLKYKEAKVKKKKEKKKGIQSMQVRFGAVLKWAMKASNTK